MTSIMRSIRRFAVVALAGLALAACASTPNPNQTSGVGPGAASP